MKEEDFYWNWLKHENTIFANRGSFFSYCRNGAFCHYFKYPAQRHNASYMDFICYRNDNNFHLASC